MSYPDQDIVEITEARTNSTAAPTDFTVKTLDDLERLRAQWRKSDSNPKIMTSPDDCVAMNFLGLEVKTLLRGEESSGRNSVHSIALAPGAAIPAHGLSSGDTFWIVVDGEVDLTIGAKTETVPGTGFGFAPPNTTQAIANNSGAAATVYVIHLPAGIERGFEAINKAYKADAVSAAEEAWRTLEPYGFSLTGGRALANDARTNETPARVDRDINTFDDFLALREDWFKLDPTPKIVVNPRDCKNVAAMGQEARVLLNPEESRGAASAFCNILHGGVDVPPHHQPTEEETFIILRGTVNLRIGNHTKEGVTRGAFGFAPRYGTHAFKHVGTEDSFVFSINTPGGHDRGFEASLRDGHKENFPEIIMAHGFTFHGPE